jgi:hypothetical protein
MISKNIDKVPRLAIDDEVILLWSPLARRKIEGISYHIVNDEIVSIYCSLGRGLSFNIVYDGDKFLFPEHLKLRAKQLDLFRDSALAVDWDE